MKGYYQPKGGKKGRFALRENTYRRTWYLIADYLYFKAIERGKSDAEEFSKINLQGEKVAEGNLLYDSRNASPDRENCEKYIAAIEEAQQHIPEAYRAFVMSHITERKPYKEIEGISEKTMKIWVQRFIWYVAHNLGDA